MKKFGGPGKLKKCRLRKCSAQKQSKKLRQINNQVLSQAHFNVVNNNIDEHEQQRPVSDVALERLKHVGPALGAEAERDEGGREENQERDQGLPATERGPVVADGAADHVDIPEHVSALEDHDYMSQKPEVGMAGKLTHPLPDHDYCLACSPVTSTVSPSSLHQMMVTTESEEVHSLAITSPENKLKFTATKGLFVSGIVIPALADVAISLESEQLGEAATTLTDTEGKYAMGPFSRDIKYSVKAQKLGYVITETKTGSFSAKKLALTSLQGDPEPGIVLEVVGQGKECPKYQEEPTMEPLAQTSKLDISIDLVPRTSETISSVPLVSPSKDALVPTTGANTSSQLLRKKYVLVSVSVSTIPVETGLAVWQVRRLNLKSESQVILSLGFRS